MTEIVKTDVDLVQQPLLRGDFQAVARKLTAELLNQAIGIMEDFDQGLRIINDLAAACLSSQGFPWFSFGFALELVMVPSLINCRYFCRWPQARENMGFHAWTWNVELFNRGQKEYQRDFKARLSQALLAYRTLDQVAEIETVLQEHVSSQYTLDLIRQFREEQTDALQSLLSLVLPLQEEGATMATRFSEYIGPTLSLHYDAVVVLVIAGMNPANSRDTISNARRFLAFSRKTGPFPHCMKAVRVGPGTSGLEECVETYKLVVIHFDSFCSQFCNQSFCGAGLRVCSNSSASGSLDFSANRDAWCQNPCTRVVAHYHQGPAISAEDLLPTLPETLSIINISLGLQEQDPTNQRVELQLANLGPGVISVRLRIIHQESSRSLFVNWKFIATVREVKKARERWRKPEVEEMFEESREVEDKLRLQKSQGILRQVAKIKELHSKQLKKGEA